MIWAVKVAVLKSVLKISKLAQGLIIRGTNRNIIRNEQSR